MRVKRFLALLLAMALTATLAMPVGAVNSSFGDVTDATIALNADILRLMGVADGTGDNQFQPNEKLTRAQFCAMVVKFMGKGDQVSMHSTRTIFSDVTAKHWGLGYVNLAASLTVKDGERQLPLISGDGYGGFLPDDNITLAQATTILIRVLGYTSEQAGAVWPQSYMNLAKSIALTDGVSAGLNEPITRAQTAQLLVNALGCKMGDGKLYYTSLGTAKEDIVLLAVNVTSDDGQAEGAVRTSDGVYLPKAAHVKPVALQGRRGALVLNEKQEIVTFVPDNSSATTIALSGDAQPTYVKSGGTQYTVASSTLVYTADKTQGDAYSSAYAALKSGTQITMFSERGKVVAIYASVGSTADSEAVVVSGRVSSTSFQQLTGGATNYKIQKNRQTITMSDIKTYDVVTYDAMTNTLLVSDLRLACLYEDASPSAKAPEVIRVLGHDFPVLESAWESIGKFNIGSEVSLLLTVDGKVAGMESTGKTRSSAIGIVTGATTAEMFLPNGGTIKLTGAQSNMSNMVDNLVTFSSNSRGSISTSGVSSSGGSSNFVPKTMRLGSYTVTSGVRIYERAGSAVVQLDLTDLDMDTVMAHDLESYHLNSSDMVDYIILKAVTGNAYTYGKLVKQDHTNTNEDGSSYVTFSVSVENGTGGLGSLTSGFSFKDGSYGGVVKGNSNNGIPAAAAMVELKEIKNVPSTAFFLRDGVYYVTVGNKTYRVAEDVEGYKDATKEWLKEETGAARLDACKAFSKDLTIYVDPVGERVRIVVAK